jgi:uncharacterized membrane protein YhiD involved in acid resistance
MRQEQKEEHQVDMYLAASLMVALGPLIVEGLGATVSDDVLRADPIRLVVAVITGVSLLGAGTILRRRDCGIRRAG